MLRLRVAYSRSERARSLAALVPSAELRIAALRLQMRNAPRAPLSLLPCAVLLPSQLRKAQLYSQLKLSSLAVRKREGGTVCQSSTFGPKIQNWKNLLKSQIEFQDQN